MPTTIISKIQEQLAIRLVIKLLTNFEKSQQHNSETVTNEHDKEIPKERYIYPGKRHKIIDNLRSIIRV